MDKIINKIYDEYLTVKIEMNEMGQKLTKDFAILYINKKKESYEKINKYLAENNENPSFFFKKEIKLANKDFDIIKIRFLIGYLETFKPLLINDELIETLKVCTNNYYYDTTEGFVVGAMEDIVDIMHMFDNKNIVPVVKEILEIAKAEEPFQSIHTVFNKILNLMPDTKEAFNIIKSLINTELFNYFEQTLNNLIVYYKKNNLIDEELNWIG